MCVQHLFKVSQHIFLKETGKVEPRVKFLRRLVITKESKEKSTFCHVVPERKNLLPPPASGWTYLRSTQYWSVPMCINCALYVSPQFFSSNTYGSLVHNQSWVCTSHRSRVQVLEFRGWVLNSQLCSPIEGHLFLLACIATTLNFCPLDTQLVFSQLHTLVPTLSLLKYSRGFLI